MKDHRNLAPDRTTEQAYRASCVSRQVSYMLTLLLHCQVMYSSCLWWVDDDKRGINPTSYLKGFCSSCCIQKWWKPKVHKSGTLISETQKRFVHSVMSLIVINRYSQNLDRSQIGRDCRHLTLIWSTGTFQARTIFIKAKRNFLIQLL